MFDKNNTKLNGEYVQVSILIIRSLSDRKMFECQFRDDTKKAMKFTETDNIK